MKFISIQEKSTDKNLPMNGRLTNIGNIKSIAFSDGILFVTYMDDGQAIEMQFKVENISYFFYS